MLSIFQAKDTRFRVSPGSIYLTDVEKRDEGIYSVSSGGYQRQDVVELKVLGKFELYCIFRSKIYRYVF